MFNVCALDLTCPLGKHSKKKAFIHLCLSIKAFLNPFFHAGPTSLFHAAEIFYALMLFAGTETSSS